MDTLTNTAPPNAIEQDEFALELVDFGPAYGFENAASLCVCHSCHCRTCFCGCVWIDDALNEEA